ncbi:MAG: 3-methyl-2-oxobutanoate hydroxymethyltransferase [Gammaproteobacteria bacterium]
MTPENPSKPITLPDLARMKQAGEKIACLTAYDASFAALAQMAGVEVVLVGDSLGMVIQGRDSTLPVTLADMIYHSVCVARAGGRALRVVDMPFMSYASTAQALANAARLMAEGGAHMVKLEGGAVIAETVGSLTAHGIPVCGHLGLLPQSVHKLGGYRVQGRDASSAQAIVTDALALQQAGAGLLVLECVPTELGGQIARQLSIPVIGIGAGPQCDGQVLVLYDILGITPGKRPRFCKDFLAGHDGIPAALGSYVQAVKSGAFPAPEHGY